MKDIWNYRLTLSDLRLQLPNKGLQTIRYVLLDPDEAMPNLAEGKIREVKIVSKTLLNFSFCFKNNHKNVKTVEVLFESPVGRFNDWIAPCFFVKPPPKDTRKLIITGISWDKYYQDRFRGSKKSLWKRLKAKESLVERGKQSEIFA